VALNKVDKLVGRVTSRGGEEDATSGDVAYNNTLEKFQREFHDAVPISAKNGENLTGLLDEITNRLRDRRVNVTLSIPHDRAKTIALVYRSGYVTARSVDNGNVVLTAQIPKVLAGELTPYVVANEE
jgi:50S ribosomal subunit-associated GTPase HflX